MADLRTIRHLLRGVFRRLVALFLNGFGSRKGRRYESVLPGATYAPWNLDDDFFQCYQKIKQYTLVDKYRCFELWRLVAQTEKLEGGLIEVGVWRGGSGALIARSAQLALIQAPVYLCDTFSGVVKSGPEDSMYRDGEHANTGSRWVEGLVRNELNLPNVQVLTGIFPDETGANLSAQKFRFCHIDVDVYQSAQDILDWVWPRLVSGGVVVYDDYGFPYCDGITRHVDEQIGRADALIVHNLNGHAVMIKR